MRSLVAFLSRSQACCVGECVYVRVRVRVCMTGQARGALRAKINKFAETNKRESEQESGLGLLNMSQTAGCWDATCGHVQHESMAKTPMRPYSNNLPISPPTLTLLLLPSKTSNVHNHFRRVCVAAVAAAQQRQTIGLRTSGQTQL